MAETKRTAVPYHPYLRFGGVVLTLCEAFGVRNDPALFRYVEMLVDALQKAAAAEINGLAEGNAKTKANSARTAFTGEFLRRFLERYGYEYTEKITATSFKIITLLCEKLDKRCLTTHDFLEWAFEKFYPANPRMEPANLRFLSSDNAFAQFVYYAEQNGLVDRNRRAAKQNLELQDIATRTRAIKRLYPNDVALHAKVGEMLANLKAGTITVETAFAQLARFEAEGRAANSSVSR